MKELEQYGQRKDEEWEWFPWLPWWPPKTRPPFVIRTRACLKIHSRHLHAPPRGIFGPNSGYIARYAPFIWAKSPTRWDAQLAESNFQTRSKPEDIAPFFFVEHHPYALSLLLKISDGFNVDIFRKMGLQGSSKDWETLVTGFMEEWEENNSGADVFHFDSDEDVFCVYSQYIDDIILFSRLLRTACNDEKQMRYYLDRGTPNINKQH